MGKKAKERKRREREAQASASLGREPSASGVARPATVNPPAAASATKVAAPKHPAAQSKSPTAPKPTAGPKTRSAAPKHAAAAPKATVRVKASTTSKPGELATRLNSVAIHLLRRLGREDTRLGLSAARLSALSVLVFGGPRTLGKLADAEGVSPPSMTRLVTAMETEGLVAREKNSADGRSVIIRASAEGERILIRGRELRVQALTGWLSELSTDGLTSLDEATATLEDLLKSKRSGPTEAPKPDPAT